MGTWKQINPSNCWILSKNVKMKHKLSFYKNARFEFTHNERNRFSQGQLAVIIDIPTQQQIENCNPIKVWAAPPFFENIPVF